MALKTLLLRSRLDKVKKELVELREKDVDFQKREKELEEAINEMTEETPEDDRKEIESQSETFQAEKEDHDKSVKDLEEEIKKIEGEIKEEEKRNTPPAATEIREREEGKTTMMERKKFEDMNMQERHEFFNRSDVKEFVTGIRSMMSNKRSIGNTELIIPEVMLPMLQQITYGASKLLKYTDMEILTGTSRMVVSGAEPEGVWTEQCGTLNELSLGFTDVEMDGFKVGGFFKVCNAILEDNDIDLTGKIIN